MMVDLPVNNAPPIMAIVESLPPSRQVGTETVEFVCRSKVYRLALLNDGKGATIKVLSGFPPARAREVAARVNEALRRNGGRHMSVACAYDIPVIGLYGDAIPGDLRFRVWFAEQGEIRIDGEELQADNRQLISNDAIHQFSRSCAVDGLDPPDSRPAFIGLKRGLSAFAPIADMQVC